MLQSTQSFFQSNFTGSFHMPQVNSFSASELLLSDSIISFPAESFIRGVFDLFLFGN